MNLWLIAYFVFLILWALWGLKWHLTMLRYLGARSAKARAEDKPKLLAIAGVNSLRYHYRVIEVIVVVVHTLLLIGITVASDLYGIVQPPPAVLPPGLAIASLIYAVLILPILASLVGVSGVLSYIDARLWEGKPARLRDLPWRHPGEFF